LAAEHYEKNVPDKNDKATHNKYYPYIWLSRKIAGAIELEKNEDGTVRVKALDHVPVAMKIFFKTVPHKVIFKKSTDGWLLPYMVSDVSYSKPKHGKASCTIQAKAVHRGTSVSVSYTWERAGRTAEQLLREAGWVVETPELLESYGTSFEKYQSLCDLTGTQVNVKDMAQASHGWVPMTVDGVPTKCVIDDDSDDIEKDRVSTDYTTKVHIPFWKDQDIELLPIFDAEEDISDEEEQESELVETYLPVHTYIKVFDLNKHRHVTTHVKNMVDYEWNHNLADKLVLDEETKSLIEILVDSTKSRTEDIIAGKMSGTIVLATGLPGVGKTLTAEVFSEKIEKSLYVVQCSQLGIDIDTIEKNLKKVLDRASRWGSILLIDEADVYIRDRGTDIVHNAIVGVFLRLIEYYNGVLFMTSNRGDIIDDAIISRATAWIRYEIPQPDLLKKIWEVLSAQFNVELSNKIIQNLVTDIPNISGRTVRNLLKLVKALDYDLPEDLGKRQLANYDHILKASKFQKLDSYENGK
jgi:AAA+ superfamily predicted ATPase